MKIIRPTVKYLDDTNEYEEHIVARAARICYASDGNNDTNLCKNLLKRKHLSMFRHLSRYYIIPCSVILSSTLEILLHNPFVQCYVDHKEHNVYISTNDQFIRENDRIRFELCDYEVDILSAHNKRTFYKEGLLRYSFVINTGIDITRELNRTSPNNIAEQSTRYVDFNKKIGILFKHCHWMDNLNLYRKLLTKFMCKVNELFYKISRSKYGLNLKPQDARWCLFLDTNSNVVYTYSFNEWKHILDLRYNGITGEPHPDAKIVAKQIYDFFKEEGYNI